MVESPPEQPRPETPHSVDEGPISARSSIDLSTHPDEEPPEDRVRETRVKFRSFDETRSSSQGPLVQDDTPELEKAETQSGLEDENGGSQTAVPTRVMSLRDKARQFMTRLGRPEEPGDALTPAASFGDDGYFPLSEHPDEKPSNPHPTSEAHRLVRGFSQLHFRRRKPRLTAPASSGQETPVESDNESEPRYGGEGILSQLLKLQGHADDGRRSGRSTPEAGTPGTATPTHGTATPQKKVKWYQKQQASQSTMSLVGAGLNLGATGTPHHMNEMKSAVAAKRNSRLEDEIRITVHIAAIITRQRYLIQLCRALMKFGAPSHRLEEYMAMTARVLEVNAQFLYLPGFMIISFDDPNTRTAEVKLVRAAQGVDLARLDDTQDVYKNVIHDVIGVEEAIQQLEDIMKRPPKYPVWLVIICYGLASAAVGPFAFEARPIDMPIIFVLGCLLGTLQLVFTPRSSLYSNVFEVLASVVTSFLARAFGSIRHGVVDGKQQYMFCFSSLAQSSIALILPGFLVLSSSLELQSHQIIAGSIRMVYAIIYSLFLGYGITVGTTIYGLIDGNANSYTSCSGPLIGGSQYVQRFPFVAAYVLFLVIINQGKWKQMPVMMFIAVAGYVVNYFSNQKLNSNPELANTLGAFTVGALGNLYSRLWHGHAASAILPAIFVLVPSGLASSGSLVSGVQSAAEIRSNLTGNYNDTASLAAAAAAASGSSVYDIGYGMIQVAIGITVGLFLAAVVIYPLGKRRSGLFSF
ncbi:hypothetical protein VTN77DRAFT_8462 [Rasamsonia byssochlamydoides]|uniref:uncharacterized protein n=1 Tax=Rasamsonia byssochlamydoides TaxID=89139 RepID=UPI0037444ADE